MAWRRHVHIVLSSWYKTSFAAEKWSLIPESIEQHLTIQFTISRLKERNLCGTSNPITWYSHWSDWYVGLVPNTKGFPSL